MTKVILAKCKRLADLIVNSPANTLIKGQIQSLAFEIAIELQNYEDQNEEE